MAKICPFCGQAFVNTAASIRHQVSQHGNPIPDEKPSQEVVTEADYLLQQSSYRNFLYTLLEQITNSQDLHYLADTYGLAHDSYIQDLLFNLRLKEMEMIMDEPHALQPYPSTDHPETMDLTNEEPPSKRPALESSLPSTLQQGGNDEPYIFRQVRQRTFAKNNAVETTYKVKFNDQWQGDKLANILERIDNMFEDILREAMEEKTGNDLGRVIIHHNALDNPIIVPLRPLEELNASTIM